MTRTFSSFLQVKEFGCLRDIPSLCRCSFTGTQRFREFHAWQPKTLVVYRNFLQPQKVLDLRGSLNDLLWLTTSVHRLFPLGRDRF